MINAKDVEIENLKGESLETADMEFCIILPHRKSAIYQLPQNIDNIRPILHDIS